MQVDTRQCITVNGERGVITAMRKQLLIVISVAVVSFLIGTMFSTNYLAIGGKPNPVWEAIADLQAKVSTLNNTVTEQQTQISELQTQVDILNVTKLGTPDYDSGWIRIPWGITQMTVSHNLGTTQVIADVQYWSTDSDPYSGGIQQRYADNTWAGGWFDLTASQISIQTHAYQSHYLGEYDCYFRVRMWKIAEP